MTQEQDIVERLLEAAGEATLKAWSVDVGKDKYQNASVLFSEAAQTIAALRAERDEAKAKLQEMQKDARKGKAAAAIMAELCAIIPIKDIIGATETGATLVAYYRSVLARAEAAEARVKELEAERDELHRLQDVARNYCEDAFARAEAAEDAEYATKDLFWVVYEKYLEMGGKPVPLENAGTNWKERAEAAERHIKELQQLFDDAFEQRNIAIRERDELQGALRVLSEVHLRDDDVSGFVIMMGATPEWTPHHVYVEAWETVWKYLRRARIASSNREGGEE